MKSSAQTNIVPFAVAIGAVEAPSQHALPRRRPRSRRRGTARPGNPAADSRRMSPVPAAPPEPPELRLARILADGFWRHDGTPCG